MLNATEQYEKAKLYPTILRPMEEMLQEEYSFTFDDILKVAALYDTVNELVGKMNALEQALNLAYKEKKQRETSEMQTMDNKD